MPQLSMPIRTAQHRLMLCSRLAHTRCISEPLLATVSSPVFQSGPAILSVYTTKLFRADPSAFRRGGELQASNPTNRVPPSRGTLSTWHYLVRASPNSQTIVLLVVLSLRSIYSVESPLTDRTLVTALCCWSSHLGTHQILRCVDDNTSFLPALFLSDFVLQLHDHSFVANSAALFGKSSLVLILTFPF